MDAKERGLFVISCHKRNLNITQSVNNLCPSLSSLQQRLHLLTACFRCL